MEIHLPLRLQSKRGLLRWQTAVMGLIIALILIALSLAVWLYQGQNAFAEAHAAYVAGECEAALPRYAQVSRYPAMSGVFVARGKTEQTECLAFIEAKGIDSTDHVSSVQVWERFYLTYPNSELAASALAQIGKHHLALGQIQRDSANFEGALSTYRRLIAGYPGFSTQAMTEQRLTYLAWGEAARATGDFAHAVTIYDEMEAYDPAFAADALAQRNEVYLAWGVNRTQQGAFAEAAAVYRVLLQREHERLAPLDLPTEGWPPTWLSPYGLSQVDLSTLQSSLRQGPGTVYSPTLALPPSSPRRFPGVAGVSPDGQWVAVLVNQWVTEQPPQSSLPATVADVRWQQSSPPHVAWAPVADIPMQLTTTITLPMSSGLLQALATQSEVSGRAVENLSSVYSAWAEAERAAGDFEGALAAYTALADLARTSEGRQRVYDELAQTHLALADQLEHQGQYAASWDHVRQAETFDSSGKLKHPLQGLHSQVLAALGEEASAAYAWDVAAARYSDVLTFERAAYGKGLAMVKHKGTRLFAAADAKAVTVQTAEPGQTLIPVAQQASDWVALLAPLAPHGLAWVPRSELTLTLVALPTVEQADLPALQSPGALVNLARAQQAWGLTLANQHEYAQADAHYRIILSDPDLRSVITGTTDLLAQADTAWGDDLSANKKTVDAVERYAGAIAAAPKSGAGTKASQALNKLAAEMARAVTDGGRCETVPTLDALAKTTVKAQAESALPQALYQCGKAEMEVNSFIQAKSTFQRIVDSYGKSTYAAKARRGIQEADWISLIKQSNLAAATDKACAQAGSTVRGRAANITKPYVLYFNGGDYDWKTQIPATWQGSDRQTNAVVCLDEVKSYQVESCPYTNGHWITRYRYYQTVRLVDPLTQVVVAQGKLYGSWPEACPWNAWFYTYETTKTYEGDRPDSSDVVAWLKKYLSVK
jgi:outer membrane protein assembly factor BamD (BamD/ComL family)